MRKTVRAATAIMIALTASGATAADKLPKQLQRLLAMTPAEFEKAAAVKDDALEVQATITTQPAFRETRGLLKIVWNDNFLRAFIDKKTGKATYQLYQRITYNAPSWKFYKLANYETPTGPESVEVMELGRDVDCSSSRLMGGCTYTETIAVPVKEELLRTIAGLYVPNQQDAWRFRFKAQSGEDFNDGMMPAEVAGMLAAVDGYRSAHSLPAS